MAAALSPPTADFAHTRTDLDAFRAGDQRAFDRLWLRYRGALEVLLAGRIRKSLDPALRARLDAELDDILQEAGLTVFGKLREFEYRGPGSILAWMARIASRAVSDRVDYWRAGRRRPARERPMQGDSSPPPGGPTAGWWHKGAGPATQHDEQQARRRVAAALADLADRDHTIVFWRFFDGATWEEIAAEVGSPSGEAVRKECTDRILPALAVTLAKTAHDSPTPTGGPSTT